MENTPKSNSFPRVLIVGTHKGVGVSTVVLGLLVTLRKKNLGLATLKIGSSLVEATHHRRILGRVSYAIDPLVQNLEQIKLSLSLMSSGTELAIMEGSGGLFDDFPQNEYLKNQLELAVFLKTPIVLVVDASNYGESIAALVYGFKNFDSYVPIYGVIANKVKDAEHNEKISKAISTIEGVDYLGGVKIGDPHQLGGTLPGLKFSNPSAITRNKLIGNAKLVDDSVNLDLLVQIANASGELELPFAPPFNKKTFKIAFADDQAFHLTIQDNLDILRRSGAEIVPFSPIADKKLPKDIYGIYLPSGYPHLYALELSNNKEMLQEIWNFVQNGGKLYAEGAALAYLSKKVLLKNGNFHDMIGILPGNATVQIADNELPKVTYQEVLTSNKSIIAPKGIRLSGFNDNRWSIRLEVPVKDCFQLRAKAEKGNDFTISDGFAPRPNVLLTRLNLHWGIEPKIADWFLRGVMENLD